MSVDLESSLRAKFAAHNQSQVFFYWDQLTGEQRASLLAELLVRQCNFSSLHLFGVVVFFQEANL